MWAERANFISWLTCSLCAWRFRSSKCIPSFICKHSRRFYSALVPFSRLCGWVFWALTFGGRSGKSGWKLLQSDFQVECIFYFRSTQETSDGANRLKNYCIYCYGFTALAILATFVSSIFYSHFIVVLPIIAILFGLMFAVIAIADVVFIIWSSVNVLRMSWSTNVSDHKWFEDQKRRQETILIDKLPIVNNEVFNRFWLYAQLFVILFVTSVVQMHSWLLYDAFDAVIVADALLCFSFGLIFCLFVLRKEARKAISERYDKFWL